MAKYTTEVRTICEQLAEYTDRQGFDEIDNVIEKAYPKIFNFDFPIFDEEYRPFLEKKILNIGHVIMRIRQICIVNHYVTIRLVPICRVPSLKY